MKHRPQRNWPQYNQRLKQIARVDFFISEAALKNWYYRGSRKPGGKLVFSNEVIELCLMLREYFKLGLRQTEGFIQSLLDGMHLPLKAPDYTTLSRRCTHLTITLEPRKTAREDRIVAIDSTGLSVYNRREWNHVKHGKGSGKWQDKWRKLHICIDTGSGEILHADYTGATVNDCEKMADLLGKVEGKIGAVCGDKAYDTVDCRKAIKERKARQLIPPKRTARMSKNNRNNGMLEQEILKERDDAISYIEANRVNNDASLARKSWKEKVGYHVRSLVETTMFQLKVHTTDHLSNRKESTRRRTQAMLKCKLINHIIAA